MQEFELNDDCNKSYRIGPNIGAKIQELHSEFKFNDQKADEYVELRYDGIEQHDIANVCLQEEIDVVMSTTNSGLRKVQETIQK